jgi:hypothetical protein
MKRIVSAAVALICIAAFLFVGCVFPAGDGVSETTPAQEDVVHADATVLAALREDYGYGACRELSGDVSVVLFYPDDAESRWMPQEIRSFTENEIMPALRFLEGEAARHGVDLRFHVEATYSQLYYTGKLYVDVRSEGYATADVLHQMAKQLHYASDADMLYVFRRACGTEEVVCLTVFNKSGTAYAINPKRGSTTRVEEHCILFARDLHMSENGVKGSQASVAAHEMLHLYGAEDYYADAGRKALARAACADDIMLSTKYAIGGNEIGEITAFYIGWTDCVPALLYHEDW